MALPKATTSPMPKRHLPIEERKKVFNEWGAILRRQDEVERAAQQESAHYHKQLMHDYRRNLDSQTLLKAHAATEKKRQEQEQEKRNLQLLQERDDMRHLSEERRVAKLRESVKAKAIESLAENDRVRAEARQNRER